MILDGFDVRWALAAVVAVLVVAYVAWRAWRRTAAHPLEKAPRPDELVATTSDAPPPEGEAVVPTTVGPEIVERHPVPTRYPIVLAHGYFGFDVIPLPKRQGYFRGVRSTLKKLGYDVHVLRLAPIAGISFRAAQLKKQVEALGAAKVNIIAHSMGGLDARYAIARLGLDARVASLTTIGTPHRGTPLSDRSIGLFGDWVRMRKMLSRFGANVDGMYDLSTRRMEAFNRDVPDSPLVAYASVIGCVSTETPMVHALLAPSYAYLSKVAGPNDGIVPADSQRWGTVLGEVFADHWAQVGWSRGFDVRAFYVRLAEQLAKLGH